MMDIPSHDELIASIEAFCARHDMAESTLGRLALGNAAFVNGLRRDPPRSPTLETLNKVRNFMAETDDKARLREKLDAPAAPPGSGGEEVGEDNQLPFSRAPVNPTGASSPTCSPTSGHPTSSAASGSCPTSSCSADGSGTFAGDEVKAA